MLTLRMIVGQVAREYGLTPKDLQDPRRTQTRVQARVEAMWRLGAEGLSYQEIGDALGGREARGILYHLRRSAKAEATIDITLESC